MDRANHTLTVVGSGLCAARHMTSEARQAVAEGQKVFYVVTGEASRRAILELNAQAEDLSGFYDPKVSRADTYQMMVDVITAHLYIHRTVCAVFYGHPAVLVNPGHMAVARARKEGFTAVMTPGISAEDCLYADLGVDPVETGCQTYGATAFLLRRPKIDPGSAMVLWQIGAVGELKAGFLLQEYRPRHLELLASVLAGHYAPDHLCCVYQASTELSNTPVLDWAPISDLPNRSISTASTLYVPPLYQPEPDAEMLEKLGLVD